MPTKGKLIILKLKLKSILRIAKLLVWGVFFATVLIHVGHNHIRDYTNAVEVESKFFRSCGTIYCIG